MTANGERAGTVPLSRILRAHWPSYRRTLTHHFPVHHLIPAVFEWSDDDTDTWETFPLLIPEKEYMRTSCGKVQSLRTGIYFLIVIFLL